MSVSSVRDLLQARWGVPLTTPLHGVVTTAVGVAPGHILRQDAGRVGFLLVNLGGGVLYCIPKFPTLAPPSSAQGIRVEANGGNLSVNWEDDGEMVAVEWQAVATAPTTLLILPVQIDQGRTA